MMNRLTSISGNIDVKKQSMDFTCFDIERVLTKDFMIN
jgi:hypothetical protein